MDPVEKLLEQLREGKLSAEQRKEAIAALTDEQLQAFEEAVRARATEDGEEAATVEELGTLADALDDARAVTAEREQAAAEEEAKREELLGRINAEAEEEVEEEETPEETPQETEEETPTEQETAEETTEETTEETPAEAPTAEEENVEEPIAAAATPKPSDIGKTRPRSRAPRPRKASNGPTIVAAADVPGVSAGGKLATLDDVGRAFAEKTSAVMRSGGNTREGRYPVASFHVEYPEDRTLVASASSEHNSELIQKVLSGLNQEAIVAAGGLCAPLEARYDVDVIAVDDRPIRDALVRFGADRGGIRFMAPPSLSDVAGASVVWTEANDTSPGSAGPATKPCVSIVCNDVEEITIDAVTRCLEVGNFQRRTFPENFNAFWALAGAAHARLAENTLWNHMVTASVSVTSGQLLGAGRDVLTALDRAVAGYRTEHRTAANFPFRFIAPRFLKDLIRADYVRQIAGDGLGTQAVTDEQIEAWFAVRGINPTWTPDANQALGVETGGALQGWPSTVDALLFPEGTFLFVDGGTLDFGMEIRDSSLNATNDVQAFTETFENVAHIGQRSLRINFDLCASGETSGTTDVTGAVCTTGS